MSEEFIVNANLFHKKGVYLVKEQLKKNNQLTVKAGVKASHISTSIVETLQRLNYAKILNIFTTTNVLDGKRRISVCFLIEKTKEFDKLFEENEERRKKFIEEKERLNPNKTN